MYINLKITFKRLRDPGNKQIIVESNHITSVSNKVTEGDEGNSDDLSNFVNK